MWGLWSSRSVINTGSGWTWLHLAKSWRSSRGFHATPGSLTLLQPSSLGADGVRPSALRTVLLSASLSDVPPEGYLPKVVVLRGPTVFLLQVSDPPSSILGPMLR